MVNSISDGWRKSSFCDTSACVEVRVQDGLIQVRDSKDPEGSVLTYTESQWATFVRGATDGEFNI